MSVVAWKKGQSIATDKQGTNNGHIFVVPKLYDGPNGEVLTFTGDVAGLHCMLQWYRDGADPSKYPEIQKTEDWCRLIVATKDRLVVYDKYPVPIDYSHLAFHAFGSGRDFAIGAMAVGASPYDAVAATNTVCDSCGLGVEFRLL